MSVDSAGALSAQELLELPYSRRRIIVVSDDQRAASAPSPSPVPGSRAFRAVVPVFPLGLGAVAGALAVNLAMDLVKASKEMRQGGEDLLTVSSAAAAQLTFPVGHPRKKVAYIVHPVEPRVYIPVADFHRYLFEHKVAEALRTIRSLGAVTIEVSRIEGWDQSVGVNLGTAVPAAAPVNADVSVTHEHRKGHLVLSTMRLTPTSPPALPENLVWLPHEPLWQEIAQARLESGLDSFTLDVRTADDYGVNASLKALIAKAGLEFGGSYVEHRDTVWRLQGAFSPAHPDTPPEDSRLWPRREVCAS